MNTQLATAYAVCRGIARSQAKNFYYGFLPLPEEKRNALCAVYAFMRHADDISDDASRSIPERRLALNSWLAEWHAVAAGTPTTDPVFFALADAQRRFQIPGELLDKLVAGTAMDLEPWESNEECTRIEAGNQNGGAATTVATYRTFEDLYRYCYYVASVVGLVCIQVYGYSDPRAEALAERCGIAFQLTNIIRDVKEDALDGRLYMPEEDLRRFGLSPEEFLTDRGRLLESARLAPLLEFESQRAREFYNAADELLPLVNADSRPALWVMFTIYRRLLDKIAGNNYDVLTRRVRLTSFEKFGILSRGMFKSLFA